MEPNITFYLCLTIVFYVILYIWTEHQKRMDMREQFRISSTEKFHKFYRDGQPPKQQQYFRSSPIDSEQWHDFGPGSYPNNNKKGAAEHPVPPYGPFRFHHPHFQPHFEKHRNTNRININGKSPPPKTPPEFNKNTQKVSKNIGNEFTDEKRAHSSSASSSSCLSSHSSDEEDEEQEEQFSDVSATEKRSSTENCGQHKRKRVGKFSKERSRLKKFRKFCKKSMKQIGSKAGIKKTESQKQREYSFVAGASAFQKNQSTFDPPILERRRTSFDKKATPNSNSAKAKSPAEGNRKEKPPCKCHFCELAKKNAQKTENEEEALKLETPRREKSSYSSSHQRPSSSSKSRKKSPKTDGFSARESEPRDGEEEDVNFSVRGEEQKFVHIERSSSANGAHKPLKTTKTPPKRNNRDSPKTVPTPTEKCSQKVSPKNLPIHQMMKSLEGRRQ